MNDTHRTSQDEEELLRRHRMEAVEAMCRHAAHDLGNLLLVAAGHVDLALERIDSNPAAARTMLDEAQVGAERMSNVLQRIRFVGRSNVSGRGPCQVAPLVEEAGQRLREGENAGIEVSLTVGRQVGWVDQPPEAVRVVLDALLKNAVEAMEPSGVIQVTLEASALEGNGDLADGTYVAVDVTDSGAGMDPEVSLRAFEPYFTTRSGTDRGWGLTIVYGIVRHAGGRVLLTSTKGEGTTVRVLLPQAAPPGS